MDRLIGPNFEIEIHGPPFWPAFSKGLQGSMDRQIGPIFKRGIQGRQISLNWSKFLKRGAGIQGPPFWSEF